MVCNYQVTNFSACGTWLPVRFLQGALVIWVHLHTSQSRSFAKCVNTLCILNSTLGRDSGMLGPRKPAASVVESLLNYRVLHDSLCPLRNVCRPSSGHQTFQRVICGCWSVFVRCNSGPLEKCANTLCFREPLSGRQTGHQIPEETGGPISEAEASPSTRFSMKSSKHSGRSRNEFPRAYMCSWVSSKSCDELPRAEPGSCDDLLCTGLCSEFPRAKSFDED